MIDEQILSGLRRIADTFAAQLGNDCEALVCDISAKNHEQIVYIVNGHVTGRKNGDVLLPHESYKDNQFNDKLGFVTTAGDGKILKSSTMFIRNSSGAVCALLCVNHDITRLSFLLSSVTDITKASFKPEPSSHSVPSNVNDLLDDLIRQSVELIGKPVPLMTKDDKIKAIKFLSNSGAFLITRSGDKVSKHFGISKYTLYSYFDAKSDDLRDKR